MKKMYRLWRYDWPMHLALLIANWLPDNVVFHRLRGWLARHFLGSCGPNLRLGRNITFYNPSKIHLGKDVYIAYGCWFMAGEDIYVGDEVIFGPYCVVVSSEHQIVDQSFRYGESKIAKVVIGRGSWIAAHVTVAAGTEIGEGTLIGANAVVSTNIPKGVLAGGIPAKVIKELTN